MWIALNLGFLFIYASSAWAFCGVLLGACKQFEWFRKGARILSKALAVPLRGCCAEEMRGPFFLFLLCGKYSENLWIYRRAALYYRKRTQLSESFQGPGQTAKHCWSNIWDLVVKQNVWPFGQVQKHCSSSMFCLRQAKNVFNFSKTSHKFCYFCLSSNVFARGRTIKHLL